MLNELRIATEKIITMFYRDSIYLHNRITVSLRSILVAPPSYQCLFGIVFKIDFNILETKPKTGKGENKGREASFKLYGLPSKLMLSTLIIRRILIRKENITQKDRRMKWKKHYFFFSWSWVCSRFDQVLELFRFMVNVLHIIFSVFTGTEFN